MAGRLDEAAAATAVWSCWRVRLCVGKTRLVNEVLEQPGSGCSWCRQSGNGFGVRAIVGRCARSDVPNQ